jgi:hypothetical protein
MSHTIEWRPSEIPWVEEAYIDRAMVAWKTRRPAYCDRGRWAVNANLGDLDGADGFPRYYMDEKVAKAETEAWLRWRLWKERT